VPIIVALTYAQSVRTSTWIEEHYFETGVSYITSTEYTKVSYIRLLLGKFVRRIKGRGSDVLLRIDCE